MRNNDRELGFAIERCQPEPHALEALRALGHDQQTVEPLLWQIFEEFFSRIRDIARVSIARASARSLVTAKNATQCDHSLSRIGVNV